MLHLHVCATCTHVCVQEGQALLVITLNILAHGLALIHACTQHLCIQDCSTLHGSYSLCKISIVESIHVTVIIDPLAASNGLTAAIKV